jgi:hypothetical protein
MTESCSIAWHRIDLHNRKAPKYRLTEQSYQILPTVLAGKPAIKNILRDIISQAKGIIMLSIGEKISVRADLGTIKFQLRATVKIDPQLGFCDL